MSSAGRRLLSHLIEAQSLDLVVKMDLYPELFRDSETTLYEFIATHVNNFGAVPTAETVEEKLGDVLVPADEPAEYYLKEVEQRYLHGELKIMLAGAQDHLNAQNPEQAYLDILNRVSELNLSKKRRSMLDFRLAADLLYAEYMNTKAQLEGQGVMFGWESLDGMTGGLRAGDFGAIVGRPASGKAQPLTSKVLLKSGWTSMGNVKVGDELASLDGKQSVVTGVFPQGVKPVVAINFKDGRRVECCTEHLWEVYSRHWPEKYRVMQAWELKNLLNSKRHQGRLAVRLFSGEFGEDKDLTIPPYLLGALIGDGCFRGGVPMFCTADPEMEDRVAQLLQNGYYLAHRKEYDFAIVDSTPQEFKQNRRPNWYVTQLTELGLWGNKSQHKFIPSKYMTASYASRLALLQGLMDTDGTADKNGGVSFSTSSLALANQVVQLVWSLGGGCSGVHVKKTTHLDNYILHIRFDNPQQSFQLKRKKDRLPTANQFTGSIRAVITSVEYIEPVECQCIMVSHPSHLYITDDYVTTHNTFMGLYTTTSAWDSAQKPLFVSMEMTKLAIAQRLGAMAAHKSLTHIMKGELSTAGFKHYMSVLESLKEKALPLWIVDGNLTANVDDLVTLCHQLKPSSVFVDGAYLLRHPNPKIGRWDRMTENAEGLKQRVATDLGIPVVASYQFSKEVAKKKKKGDDSKTGVEDIYGSDAIAQLASVVLGLFEPDSVETEKRRMVNVLKGRNGETGQFLINWDFVGMNFNEIPSKMDENGNLVTATQGMSFLG